MEYPIKEVDETVIDPFALILLELKSISERLRRIEETISTPKPTPSEPKPFPKVKTRINLSGDLSRILEKRSLDAKNLLKSAEDVHEKV